MRHIRLLLILFVSIVLGGRFLSVFVFSRSLLPGEIVRVTERLTEQPYQTRSAQIFRLGEIKVMAPLYPSYNYGEVIIAEGELKEFTGDQDKGLPARLKPQLWLVYPRISVLSRDENSGGLMRLLVKLRLRLVRVISEILPEPHAALLSGIVLGAKIPMNESFAEKLRNSGTLHVIVASGMNISIVAALIIDILVFVVSRGKAIFLAIVGVLVYTLLAGAEAPIVRAAIMGVVGFGAVVLGRERSGLIALLIAVAVMLAVNPLYLFDVGWQLSVMATLGILAGYPILIKVGPAVGSSNLFKKELAVTLAAQIGVLPLLVYHFGSLSLIAPVVNVLVAPIIPILMIGGGLAAVLGLFWLGLARILGWGLWALLEYFVILVKAFGGSFSLVEVGRLSGWWVAGYYLLFVWLLGRVKGRPVAD